MGANLPGQSARSWGQEIQVAAWGSHSAGMRKPSAAGFSCPEAETFLDWRGLIGVTPAASRTSQLEVRAMMIFRPLVALGLILALATAAADAAGKPKSSFKKPTHKAHHIC